jgi:adenylate cyclase class IV
MYEVEYKVEINKAERDSLFVLFDKKDFQVSGPFLLNDYYIEAEKSKFGGYNIKRYRDDGVKVIYTEKIWEDNNGEKVRKEAEREVGRTEFISELAMCPNVLKIQKERQSYSGIYRNQEIHIDMDSVKFDHSPTTRYFIEAEILSTEKDDVGMLKSIITDFLKELLGRSEMIESPSMFNMAFNKL